MQDFKDVAKLLNMARVLVIQISEQEKKKNTEYWKLFQKAVNGIDETRYAMDAIMRIKHPSVKDIFYPEITVKIEEE